MDGSKDGMPRLQAQPSGTIAKYLIIRQVALPSQSFQDLTLYTFITIPRGEALRVVDGRHR